MKKISKISISLIIVTSIIGVTSLLPLSFILKTSTKKELKQELFKSINLLDADKYLSTDYKLEQASSYNNDYFDKIGFLVNNNIDISDFDIEKVSLIECDNDNGSGKIKIDFKSYKSKYYEISNFLKYENSLKYNIENNNFLEKSVPSYFINNSKKLKDIILANEEYEVKILETKDDLGLINVQIKNDYKLQRIWIQCSNYLKLFNTIKSNIRIKNYDTTPSRVKEVFDIDNLKNVDFNYNNNYLHISLVSNDSCGRLTFKISYNAFHEDINYDNFLTNNEFNEYNLFQKIRYTLPIEKKFLIQSINLKNDKITLDYLCDLGFYNIDHNLDMNKLSINKINNKFELFYKINSKVYKREFAINIYDESNPEKSIDSEILDLIQFNKKIDPNTVESNLTIDNSYEEIKTTIDNVFNEYFLKDIDKTIQIQISNLVTNFVNNFITYNLFNTYSYSKFNMENTLSKLLNTLSLNYEFEYYKNQLIYNINIFISNDSILGLPELKLNDNISIKQNEIVKINWKNSKINGENNLIKILNDDDNLDIGFSDLEFSVWKKNKNLRDATTGYDSVLLTLNSISLYLSFGSLIAMGHPIISGVLGVSSILISAISIALSFFGPSEIAVKYSQSLDLSYSISKPIWNIYINGYKNSCSDNIINSFINSIEKSHIESISKKSLIYKIIEKIISNDVPSERNLKKMLNDGDFIRAIDNLISTISNVDSYVFYEYVLLCSVSNSDKIDINKNLLDSILIVINNELSKIIIDQMDICTQTILKSISSHLLDATKNYILGSKLDFLINEINSVNSFINSKELENLVYEFIINNLPKSSENLVDSISSIIRNEWIKIMDIFKNVSIHLEKINSIYLDDESNIINNLSVMYLVSLCKKIIYFYNYSETNRKYISEKLSYFGLKDNMLIPLLRIISTYGSYNDLTNLDVIWIITNFIRYTNFKWEWLNLSDSEINNLVNKRTVTIPHYVGGPYCHEFRFYTLEVWQIHKMFKFLFDNIYDEDGNKFTLSEMIANINWTYSYDLLDISLNEKSQILRIGEKSKIRTILGIENNKRYFLNFNLLKEMINNDNSGSTKDHFITLRNFWNKKWYTANVYSNNDLLDFINSSQDYHYNKFGFNNKNNEFIFTENNGKINLADSNINMCIPSIDSRLIDKTTYNISNKTYIKSKIGGDKNYWTNIFKDFVSSFYRLIYENI